MVKFLKIILISFWIFAATAALATRETHFQKKTLTINKQKLTVELADTLERQAQGLMFRTQLKDDEGMLFVFNDFEVRTFWMKNTFLDLSIGFFDQNKKLLEFFDMQASNQMELHPKTYDSKFPSAYALEVPKGWFKKHKVQIGSTFTLK
jgi:uncharacterized membrane protein (UPF0127 family)